MIRHSFVVRLWREDGQCAWLGSVQHTGSGVEVCVSNLDELLAFIERWTGPPSPAWEAVPRNPRRRLRKPEPPAAHLK